MRAWTAIVVAGLALAGCGDEVISDPPRADLPLTYSRQYGGAAGGSSELTVQSFGEATVTGAPPGQTCGAGPRRFKLGDAALFRLRRLVEPLPLVRPRTRVQSGVEGDPTIVIEASNVTLRYVGLDVTPPSLDPLLRELDRLVANHC